MAKAKQVDLVKKESQKQQLQQRKKLFEAILELRSPSECEQFFTDLCTPQEIKSLAERWGVAKLLNKDIPYRQIYDQTGVSTATVTRVARSLLAGKGGYRMVLDRLGEN